MHQSEMVVLPAQRALIESTNRLVAMVGGYGSGKTRGAAYKSLQLILANPAGIPGVFVEPTYAMVRDVAVRGFQEAYAEMNVPTWYKANESIMNVGERSDILFRSGDRPELLVGLNVAWAGLDEPAIQPEEVAKALNSRIRHPKATLRQLFFTGTPEGYNWFFEWCQQADMEVVRARTQDNPFLPVEYVQGLIDHLSPEEQRAYLNGEFVSFDGAWYRVAPRRAEGRTVEHGIQVFRPLEETSKQIVIAVDTGGGLGRDASAIAVVDKRDKTLCASWKDNRATIHEMTNVISHLVGAYTARPSSPAPGLVPVQQARPPHVRIEKNGIGIGTYQECMRRGLECSEVNTTEASRYAGLEACRIAASEGYLAGGEDLLEEARLLVTKDQKFKGPKDLSMAIGMAYNYCSLNPYRPPTDPRNAEILSIQARLGGKRGWRR